MIELMSKPPFRFVGNKSNRREDIIFTLEQIMPKCDIVCDLFAGSMYCSHLVSVVKDSLPNEVDLYINDYDGYSNMFTDEFRTALESLYEMVETTNMEHDEILEPELCMEIDILINKHDKYRQFLLNYLSMYGTTRKYRRRVSVPKHLNIEDYVTAKEIMHRDYSEFIDIMADKRKDVSSVGLWICDPPYHSAATKVNYKGKIDIPPINYCSKILANFPYDIIINFSYEKSLQVGNHNVKLDNIFVRPSGGIAKTSKMEYTHIIRR